MQEIWKAPGAVGTLHASMSLQAMGGTTIRAHHSSSQSRGGGAWCLTGRYRHSSRVLLWSTRCFTGSGPQGAKLTGSLLDLSCGLKHPARPQYYKGFFSTCPQQSSRLLVGEQMGITSRASDPSGKYMITFHTKRIGWLS